MSGAGRHVEDRQTTREIVKSFKRNASGMRKKLATKYWKRTTHWMNQTLHAATNLMMDMEAAS